MVTNYSLSALENLNSGASYYQTRLSFTDIRARAVKQAAESLGMQAGLAKESKLIDKVLLKYSQRLSFIFDFRGLMYKNNVLPPVLEQAKNLIQIGNKGDDLRVGGVTYRIIKQVRFVTVPPTWRDYIWMGYSNPSLPSKVLLPKTKQERLLWKRTLNKAWNEGLQQGIEIFKVNLHRLVRDYTGMVLYKELLMENMVSPYYVTKKVLGITGNGTNMVIDDQNWQITNKPMLQIHSRNWQPLLISSGA